MRIHDKMDLTPLLLAFQHVCRALERPPLLVGELALSGDVLPVRGVLPIGLEARRLGFQELIVPEPNAPEGALVRATMPGPEAFENAITVNEP